MWVMSSKRYRGSVGSPPHVEFCIGAIKIANIIMQKPTDQPWAFRLAYGNFDGQEPEFRTFSEALKHLHTLLNSPSPEGFET